MKVGIVPVATETVSAAGGVGAPRALYVCIAIAVGVLAALVIGILHRSDLPDPAVPSVKYSVQAAVMRSGLTVCGTASLMLSALMSPERGTSLFIVLVSVAAGIVYALLAYYDSTAPSSTFQAAVWRGLTVTASACTLGQAFLALYL